MSSFSAQCNLAMSKILCGMRAKKKVGEVLEEFRLAFPTFAKVLKAHPPGESSEAGLPGNELGAGLPNVFEPKRVYTGAHVGGRRGGMLRISLVEKTFFNNIRRSL